MFLSGPQKQFKWVVVVDDDNGVVWEYFGDVDQLFDSTLSYRLLCCPKLDRRYMFDDKRKMTSMVYLISLGTSIAVCFIPFKTGPKIGILVLCKFKCTLLGMCWSTITLCSALTSMIIVYVCTLKCYWCKCVQVSGTLSLIFHMDEQRQYECWRERLRWKDRWKWCVYWYEWLVFLVLVVSLTGFRVLFRRYYFQMKIPLQLVGNAPVHQIRWPPTTMNLTSLPFLSLG